jgi:hypothetical protein
MSMVGMDSKGKSFAPMGPILACPVSTCPISEVSIIGLSSGAATFRLTPASRLARQDVA